MPEYGITRERLRNHFLRLWVVYLAGIVLLVFLNNLVYTITRPGYSAAETFKIMLVNADVSLQEDALLQRTEPLGFRAVEMMELSFSPEDAASRMLLITQLISGDADVYIIDAPGLAVLNERGVCRSVRELESGLYIAAVNDEQNVCGALEILINELGE